MWFASEAWQNDMRIATAALKKEDTACTNLESTILTTPATPQTHPSC